MKPALPHFLFAVLTGTLLTASGRAQIPYRAHSHPRPHPHAETETQIESESETQTAVLTADEEPEIDAPAPTEADAILGLAPATSVAFRAEFNDEFNVRLPGDPEFVRLREEIAQNPPTALTESQALRVFGLFEKYSISGDAYGFDSRCYARNFWWQTILRLLSIESRAALVMMKGFPFSIVAGSLKPYGTESTWNYHIAPTIRVLDAGGKSRWFVFDPALFSAPASTAEWRRAASGMRADFVHSKIVRASDHALSGHDARASVDGWWTKEAVAEVAGLFGGKGAPTFRRRPMIRR